MEFEVKIEQGTQQSVEEAMKIIQEVINLNPQINQSSWYDAFDCLTAWAHHVSGYSYETYCKRMNYQRDFYKRYFEKKDVT